MTTNRGEEPGLGRRDFLKMFAGVAAVASSVPLTSVFVSDDLYVNHKFGLAFRKPIGWRYEGVRTFSAIRNEYEYATSDKSIADELKAGPLPLVVVSQASILRSLASSVTVFVEQNPLAPNEALSSVFPQVIRWYSGILRDFQLIQGPSYAPLRGCNSAEYVASFNYKDRLGNDRPVRHRGLAILREPFLYTFNMLDIPADNINSQAEFDQLRDSIVLA
jgi:hypothetical protein